MQINKEVLKSLNPCDNRYEHFLEHHGEFSGSFNDFLDLTNVEYSYKIWVAVRVLTKNQLINWSILFAESVVHIFEDKHPDDKSLSDCINFLKTVNDFDNLTDTERKEIEKHMDIIRDYYASYAANATTLAAAYAVNAVHSACAAALTACVAADAVNYAARAANYATNAAFHATNADGARNNQKELNIQFLKQVINA